MIREGQIGPSSPSTACENCWRGDRPAVNLTDQMIKQTAGPRGILARENIGCSGDLLAEPAQQRDAALKPDKLVSIIRLKAVAQISN